MRRTFYHNVSTCNWTSNEIKQSTRQTDRKLDDAVKVSAVMIDVIPEPVDIPVNTGLAGAKNSTNDTPPLFRQMTSEDDLSVDEEVVADSKFRDTMVRGPTSTPQKIAGLTADLAGDVTVGVSSSANLAGDVTVGVASSADLAEVFTIGVASSADLAGDVTISVLSPADLAGFLGPDDYELYHDLHGSYGALSTLMCHT